MANQESYDLQERIKRSQKLNQLVKSFGDAREFRVFVNPLLSRFIEEQAETSPKYTN